MIELYGFGSPNVFKVIFALSELDLPYRFTEVNVTAREQFTEGFRALNPNSKVPVLIDQAGPGGKPHTVFESGAILIYLAEKTGRLLGSGPIERSDILQWTMFQVAGIGPMFGQALHFLFIAPEGNDYARHRYLGEVNRLYDVVEARLTQTPWLGGGVFSIADIAAYPWLGRYVKTLGIDLARRPCVQQWIEKTEGRPGWQRIDRQCRTLFRRSLELQRQARPHDLDVFFGRTGLPGTGPIVES